MVELKDILICGYFDETDNYIIEIDKRLLKKYLQNKNTDMIDFETNKEVKIKLFDFLRKEFGTNKNYNEFCINLV